MPKAVCRIQKIKSWGLLKGNEAHTARTRETPNANPEVTNIRIIGNPDNFDLVTLVKKKIGSQKIRSNAVLAVEILLSASAEYFRPNALAEAGSYDKKRLDGFVEATVSWLKSSWGEQVVRAELHLDEITPHIHAYIVPLSETGKLNCRALFGGREKLSLLQDSFADAVLHLGISRGVKGSTATYTSLKKYYAAVNQDSQLLDLERCLPQPEMLEKAESYRQRVIDILSPQLEIINYQLSDRSRLIKQKSQLQQTAFVSEQLRQQLERELRILRTKTSQNQDLPLELIAYELGLNQDQQDKNKWSSKTHTIKISNSYFYQELGNHGSKNVIDFVMQILHYTFNDAVIWLHDRLGLEHMLTAIAQYTSNQTGTKFIPPTSSLIHWAEIAHHLAHNYSIPQSLLQTLHKRRLIYAEITGKAVFILRNFSGEFTGAYLQSPNEFGYNFSLYPGSKRSNGWFHLSMGGNPGEPIKRAILVSSPIEVLSIAALNSPHKYKTLYLVIDSDYAQLPLEILQAVPSVLFNNLTRIQKLIPHAAKFETFSSCDLKQLEQSQG
jgi:hypothetical protein